MPVAAYSAICSTNMVSAPAGEDEVNMGEDMEATDAELGGARTFDSWYAKQWAQVPEETRKSVEEHVAANMPEEILAKWRDQHVRGVEVGSDEPIFHFGTGMVVRNLCRERLKDDELLAHGLWGDWDRYYCVVVAAIAARRH